MAENTLPTHHSKILVAKVSVPEHDMVRSAITELKSHIIKKDTDINLVGVMKKIVPEFKSNRSVYEVLD
mgnify:CR=1 FL=1